MSTEKVIVKSSIEKELASIERVCNVEILLAVESGSRAWGMASQTSDYDVRFVYTHPLDDYLTLKEARDVIEWKLDETLDIAGWDIRKYLRLMRNSNPTVFEWLSSPIIYKESINFFPVRTVAEACYTGKASAFHYLGMAHHEIKRIHKNESIPIKTYLYAIRAILAARWSICMNDPAPILINDLIQAELEPNMRSFAENLISIRSHNNEATEASRNKQLDTWLEIEWRSLNEKARALPSHEKIEWKYLDDVFRGIIAK